MLGPSLAARADRRDVGTPEVGVEPSTGERLHQDIVLVTGFPPEMPAVETVNEVPAGELEAGGE